MVLLYGFWRNPYWPPVDVSALRGIAQSIGESCRSGLPYLGNRRAILRVRNTSIDSTVFATASADHAFIALCSGEFERFSKREDSAAILPDFYTQGSAIIEFLRVKVALIHG